jgi:uncharacterized protein YukE
MARYREQGPLNQWGLLNVTMTDLQQISGLLHEPGALTQIQQILPKAQRPLFEMLDGRGQHAAELGPEIAGSMKKLGDSLKGAASPSSLELQANLQQAAEQLQNYRQRKYIEYTSFAFEKEAFSTGSLARLYTDALNGQK